MWWSPIRFVEKEKLERAESQAFSKLSRGPGSFERWEQCHEKLKAVLVQYGTVSWHPDPLPDFYFSGDWFHECTHSFDPSNPASVSSQLLLSLQNVLQGHDKTALLFLWGDEKLDGLRIFLSTSQILICWEGLTPEECRARLKELGAEID